MLSPVPSRDFPTTDSGNDGDGVAAHSEYGPHGLPAWIGAMDENNPTNVGIVNTVTTANLNEWLLA